MEKIIVNGKHEYVGIHGHTIKEAICMLTEAMEVLGKDTRVDVQRGDVYVEELRLETDEEFEKRKTRREAHIKHKEDADRKLYDVLKAKFEGK